MTKNTKLDTIKNNIGTNLRVIKEGRNHYDPSAYRTQILDTQPNSQKQTTDVRILRNDY